MDNFNANSIAENFPNVCRCCLAEGCYKDISSEYFISGKKEVYEEMLKDVFNLEISYQKYGGPSEHSRLICENCIGKLRDAREFKYKVLASEKSFIKLLDDMQINVKKEVNIEDNQEADIISENCAIKLEPELYTNNDVENCENDVLENSQVLYYDDVVGVKLESESNTDNEIESHETLEDQTDGNHTETFENLQLQLNKDLNKLLTGGATSDVCDKRKLTTESNTKNKKPRLADEGTSRQLPSQCEEDSQIRHQPIPQPQNTLQQNASTRSICTNKTQTANIKGFKEVTVDKQISSVNSLNESVTNRGDCLRKEQMNAEKQKCNEQRIANSTDKTNGKLTINPEDKDTANNHLSSYSVDELPSLPTDMPRKEEINTESRPPNQKDQKCISQRPNVQQPGSSLRTVSGIAHERGRRLRKRLKELMELEEMMLWALL